MNTYEHQHPKKQLVAFKGSSRIKNAITAPNSELVDILIRFLLFYTI